MALVPRVRGGDAREEGARGLEVVIVALDAGGLEALDLLPGEDAHGDRDVDVHLGVHGGDGLLELDHEALVRALDRGDDAELGGTGLLRLLRGLDELGDVELHRTHRGFEEAGLGAEVAVLGTAAGLEGDDALDLHLLAAPAQAHLVGEVEQLGQVGVVEFEDLEQLGLGEALALVEGGLAGAGEDVGGHAAPCVERCSMQCSRRVERCSVGARRGMQKLAGRKIISQPHQRKCRNLTGVQVRFCTRLDARSGRSLPPHAPR